MAECEIDSSCIDRLQEKLQELGRKGNAIRDKALMEGAEIINKEIKMKCPVSDSGEHARDFLKVSEPKNEKGRRVVKIGIQKEDNSEAYYLKFYEFGTVAHNYKAGGYFKGATVHHPGQVAKPFMRPAFDRKKGEAAEKTKDVIRKELGIK